MFSKVKVIGQAVPVSISMASNLIYTPLELPTRLAEKAPATTPNTNL